jgi:hypothetical protein
LQTTFGKLAAKFMNVRLADKFGTINVTISATFSGGHIQNYEFGLNVGRLIANTMCKFETRNSSILK